MGLTAGTRLGPFTVVRLIGAGGMGEVYLADDPRLHRRVALKLLPAELASDPDRRARFEREARAAAALSHPNICTIHEIGEAEGRLFIAMEFLDGQTLAEALQARSTPMSVAEVCDIGIQLADALNEARKAQVVHRDLKSANIILLPRGQVKILDFGLAKHTRPVGGEATTVGPATEAGLVVGTAAYMSPEQALGRDVDHRSDLFSLGVVLYELLTGRLPFAGRTGMELFNAIVNDAPAPIARFNDRAPDGLVAIVTKLLEKDRERRYQSAQEVWSDLTRIKDGGPSPRAARRSRPMVHLAIGAVVVAGAALGVWRFWPGGSRHLAASDVKSIVVVPTVVQGAQLEQWYATAVPETLSAHLVQIRGLITKLPPTIREMEPIQNDLQKVADAYGVDGIVQSSLLIDRDRLHLNVRLVEPASRDLMWSQDFEGSRDEYLALIGQAAERIREYLRPAAPTALVPQNLSKVPAAEQALRQGKHYSDLYNYGHDEGDFKIAEASLSRAFELDPTLADAAARLGMLYLYRREAGHDWAEVRPQIERWATAATAADPRSALGWIDLVSLKAAEPNADHDQLFRSSLKALALAPNDSRIIAVSSFWADSFRVGLAAMRQSEGLEPLYLYAYFNAAEFLISLNRSDEASAHLRAPLARDPTAAMTFRQPEIRLLADLNRVDEAQRELDQLRDDVKAGRHGETTYRAEELQVLIARRDPGVDRKFEEYLKVDPLEMGSLYFWGPEPLVAAFAHADRLDLGFRVMSEADRNGLVANFDFLAGDDRLKEMRKDPRLQKYLAKSRARCVQTVAALDEMKAHGDLPAFYEEPLRDLKALLAR